MSLESKNYVASPTDIESLTRSVLEAAIKGIEGRNSYLRALIATTQFRLRDRSRHKSDSAVKKKLSPTERDRQISVLESVNEEFYSLVKKTAYDTLKAQGRYTAIEHNKRCNFARSSMSVVRTWIKAGNDITNLVATRTTKAMLAVAPRKGRPPSTRILTNQIARYMESLKPIVITLVGVDSKAGYAELTKIEEQIQEIKQSARLGKPPPRHGREARLAS